MKRPEKAFEGAQERHRRPRGRGKMKEVMIGMLFHSLNMIGCCGVRCSSLSQSAVEEGVGHVIRNVSLGLQVECLSIHKDRATINLGWNHEISCCWKCFRKPLEFLLVEKKKKKKVVPEEKALEKSRGPGD